MGFLSRLFSRGVGEGTDALRATATEPLSPAQRAEYLRLLEIFNTNRIDYNTRKWETIKFAESAFTVLFGAAIVGVYTKLDVLSSSWLLKILFATLCFLAFLSAILGAVNLARESVLLYVEEGSAFKLAHLLELDRDVGPRPWLRGDQRLLPQKWREPGACNKTI